MEAVLEAIYALSPIEGEWIRLKERLGESFVVIVDAGSRVIAADGDGGVRTILQGIIQELLGYDFTIATAVLLVIQADVLPEVCNNQFLHQAKIFFSKAIKNQISFVIKEAVSICNKLTSISQRLNCPRAIIRTLVCASELLATTPFCLTPIHSKVLQACISGQVYSFAVTCLRNKTILEIEPKSRGLTSLDFLTYFYYAGICFTAVKDFPTALEHFDQAITAPAQVVSAVVIECVKKAQLVSLIYSGSAHKLPKYTSQPIKTFVKQDLQLYDNLAKAVANSDEAELRSVLTAGREELTRDNNWGLAQQVLTAHSIHKIRKLSSTYLTLSLADITAAVGAPDVLSIERTLVHLIGSGEMDAHIDEGSGLVHFDSSKDQDSAGSSVSSTGEQRALIDRLQRHICETVQLSEKLREMHKATLTSTAYISRSLSSSSGGRAGGATGVVGGWDPADDPLGDYHGVSFKG